MPVQVLEILSIIFVRHGRGTADTVRTIKLRIPAGVNNFQLIQFPGKGDRGDRNSGKMGNLLFPIHVKEHPRFVRENLDIFTRIPITVSQAILGGNVKVPTVDGEMEVSVNPGTQPLQKLSLLQKGAPDSAVPESAEISTCNGM